MKRTTRGLLALMLAATLTAAACSSDGDDGAAAQDQPAKTTQTTAGDDGHGHDGETSPEAELYGAVRQLWAEHMQWTYITVDAYFHNPDAVQPSLDRLLANQVDLGKAIAPFYGEEAGDQLTELLTTHIQQAVPVLEAAQAGDQAALEKALDDWYANAKEIADFLSTANAENWPESATEPMMKEHIDTTVTYATDLLKGDYEKAIENFDKAYDHMMEMADVLAAGIVAQFPEKF